MRISMLLVGGFWVFFLMFNGYVHIHNNRAPEPELWLQNESYGSVKQRIALIIRNASKPN